MTIEPTENTTGGDPVAIEGAKLLTELGRLLEEADLLSRALQRRRRDIAEITERLHRLGLGAMAAPVGKQ
jgi:hypothetical protein